MRRIVGFILGILLAANGLFMIEAPLYWYAFVPGVNATGPANVHFIRDIGCAYLAAALALLWFSFAPQRAWPAVLAGGTFLLLHALVHVSDTMTGREQPHRLLAEVPTVFLPAVLVLWLGWPPKTVCRKES